MDDPHLLQKRGLWYGPAFHGYTSDLFRAGLYPGSKAKEHANSVDGCSAVPISEVKDELLDQIYEAKHHIAELEGALSMLNDKPTT